MKERKLQNNKGMMLGRWQKNENKGEKRVGRVMGETEKSFKCEKEGEDSEVH
ncbi:hypothetical protein ABEW32_03265 [Paenibacillus jamilae]|uniref:hypothetical protein n=1 Tax=Paenibacillus jamilae TaxID=114136 RepID=UPI003D2CB76C